MPQNKIDREQPKRKPGAQPGHPPRGGRIPKRDDELKLQRIYISNDEIAELHKRREEKGGVTE